MLRGNSVKPKREPIALTGCRCTGSARPYKSSVQRPSSSLALMPKDRIVVYTLAVIVVFEAAFLGFMFALTRPW